MHVNSISKMMMWTVELVMFTVFMLNYESLCSTWICDLTCRKMAILHVLSVPIAFE